MIKNKQVHLPKTTPSYYFAGSWLRLIRPLTLTGTITPILVGTAYATKSTPIRWELFFALIIASVLIQATTNLLNDYFDFQNGQDKEKWVHQTNPTKKLGPPYELLPYIAGFMLVIAMCIGCWLAIESSLLILPVGVISIWAGIKYSAGTRSLSSIGLGELVAFIFLGFVVTILSYVVQGLALNIEIILLAVPFAFLIVTMILTNNIRDIKKDAAFRKTIAIVLGKKRAVALLAILLVSIYIMMTLLIALKLVPIAGLFTFSSFPLAIRLLYAYRKHASISDESSGMKWAALHHWTFGGIYAFIMFFG